MILSHQRAKPHHLGSCAGEAGTTLWYWWVTRGSPWVAGRFIICSWFYNRNNQICRVLLLLFYFFFWKKSPAGKKCDFFFFFWFVFNEHTSSRFVYCSKSCVSIQKEGILACRERDVIKVCGLPFYCMHSSDRGLSPVLRHQPHPEWSNSALCVCVCFGEWHPSPIPSLFSFLLF